MIPHLVKQLLCFDYLFCLYTRLDETSVNYQTRLDLLPFHLLQDTKSFVELGCLRVDLDQDAISNIGRLNFQTNHVLVNLHCQIDLVTFAAAIKQRVI